MVKNQQILAVQNKPADVHMEMSGIPYRVGPLKPMHGCLNHWSFLRGLRYFHGDVHGETLFRF